MSNPSEPQYISIERIVVDPEVQARAKGTVPALAAQYADAMREGAVFPPADVFYDGATYMLADGFHRVAASRILKADVVACTVHVGGRRDAILFAVGANAAHGQSRSPADRRHAIAMLLTDPEWCTRSDAWIAKAACVSHQTVVIHRKRMNLPRGTVGRDGRSRSKARQGDAWGGLRHAGEGYPRLLQLIEERGEQSLIEASNMLSLSPRRVLAMAEMAAKNGKPVTFTSERNDRVEHQLRGQVRELAAAKKRLLEELRVNEAHLGTMTGLREAGPFEPIVAKKGIGEGKRRQGTPVLMLSDLHVEETVYPETVNGLNEYNLDIAERCLERCAEAFEWFAQDTRWDMREAIIAILGDTYSGYIHAELQEGNSLSPVQAVVWLLERFERLIKMVLKNTDFERITVVCKDGNHGRLTQKMRAATRTENSLEWLMYKQLAALFRNEPRVRFIIEDGLYTYLQVYDQMLGFTHGDQFRYQGGIGGLLIPVRRGLNEIRKYKPGNTVFCLGHFHERLDMGDIVVNGSLIGVTPYSLSINVKPEPRAQHWFIVDSVHGKLAPTAPVWLPTYGGTEA